MRPSNALRQRQHLFADGLCAVFGLRLVHSRKVRGLGLLVDIKRGMHELRRPGLLGLGERGGVHELPGGDRLQLEQRARGAVELRVRAGRALLLEQSVTNKDLCL